MAEQANSKTYFWDKKTIVSYYLSIMVFWIHISTLGNYGFEAGINKFFDITLKRSYSFVAVALFFMLSGAAFYRDYSDKSYFKKLKTRLLSLVVPYLLWNIFNMLFDFFASTFLSQYFVGRELFEPSLSNILLGIFHYKYNDPFWFIFALIIFAVCAPVIDKLLYSKLTAILSVVVLLVLHQFGYGLPIPFFYTQTCIIFYLVGGFVGRFYFDSLTRPVGKVWQWISVPATLCIIAYLVSEKYGLIPYIPVLNTLVLILGSIALWWLFDLFVAPTPKVRTIHKHSFWVFALHLNVSAVVTKLLFFALPKQTAFGIVNFILTTVITLAIIELICFALSKILPRVYAVLSGARQ